MTRFPHKQRLLIEQLENRLVPDATSYVTSLYHNVLGRAPDAAGLASWVSLINSGVSYQAVATGFWQSPEHRALEVTSYYQVFLNRAPDAAGLAFWVNQMTSGAMGELTVEANFATSPEFVASHNTPAAFVSALYVDFLGRSPTISEQAAWESILAVSGAPTVTVDIETSAEAYTRILDAYYTTYLNRSPDTVGLAYWLSQLQTGGQTVGSVAELILSSTEYINDNSTSASSAQTSVADPTQASAADPATDTSVAGTTILTATLSGTTGSGRVTYFSNSKTGTNTLAVKVSGLTADTTYTVMSGTGVLGTITTNARGSGRLFESTSALAAGDTITIINAQHATVLSGTLATPTTSHARTAFQATLTGATGSGHAFVIVNASTGTTQFDLHVSGLTADTTYTVQVNGTMVGQLTTNSRGSGRLSESNITPTVSAGSTVTVLDSAGATVLSGTFAEVPTKPHRFRRH
jgi:ribosomal protein L13